MCVLTYILKERRGDVTKDKEAWWHVGFPLSVVDVANTFGGGGEDIYKVCGYIYTVYIEP
ncbi:hypothetical protein Hdeb2414_s0003g00094161 [Helianthus debilis subsp. tardiflorus]